MNCDEVKRRLKKDAVISDEISAHFETCPSCARSAESSLLLGNLFRDAKETENYPSTPMPQIRDKITPALTKTNQKENIMSQIKKHPKLIYGLGLALVAFLFITLVPFPYTQTVGYELTMTGLDNQTEIPTDKLAQVISSLGYENVSISKSGSDYIFTILPDKKSAREIAAAFNVFAANRAEAVIESVVQKVTGSLYAQVINSIKVEVDVEGKTDEQIAEEIKQQILASGVMGADVTVSSDDESRKIDMTITQDDDGKESVNKVELMLLGDDDISFEAPDPMPKLDIDTEGKTDQEIVDEVREKLAQQGHPDANVKVITNENGEKEIMVGIEKEETR